MADIRLPYGDIVSILTEILMKYPFTPERAELCATLFAKANLDGVPSHGLNRFSLFLSMIDKEFVHPEEKPELMGAFGSFERWNGKLGPGNLNAYHCMGRAIELAKTTGMGCVALSNTNHWLRGGNFGWQAVEEDCLGICFTNTKPNMPAWGGKEPKLGNNPIIFAVPHKKRPIVLDMALSQFSYGKISTYLRENELLPYDAGFDKDGNLTREPAHILQHELALPIGLWKGAGMSFMLDILVSVLSDGNSTTTIGKTATEYALSQFFLCFYLPRLGITTWPEDKIEEMINDLKSSATFDGGEVRYPGESTLAGRTYNTEHGVPVNQDVWNAILERHSTP